MKLEDFAYALLFCVPFLVILALGAYLTNLAG
jgi:hypothetical protein